MGWIKINTNRKLGNMGRFSIPSRVTCPGATESCLSVCYTKKGFFCFPKIAKGLQNALELTKDDSFVGTISREIRNNNLSLIRVHVSGDFYSPEYVNLWIAIAKRSPNTKFYAYTRSWTIKEFKTYLVELANLPNFVLFASVDRDNQKNTIPSPLRTAYMSMDDEAPDFPVDIVFRVNQKKEEIKNYLGSSRVCPKETGLKKEANKNLTCVVCKLCFK